MSIRTVYLFQYYTYIPPILPDFLRLIAKGSNTQLKEIGCHIPDSVHIVAISVRFSLKRRGKQLSMNSCRLWNILKHILFDVVKVLETYFVEYNFMLD